MQLILEIPDQFVQGQNHNQLAQQVKLYTAMLMFQSGQLSRRDASAFAGVNILDFFQACKQYQIIVTNTSAESIEVDVSEGC